MRSFFLCPTVFQNQNAVGVLNRRETVSDHDERFPSGQFFQSLLQQNFVFRIGERGRFVQEDDRRVFEHHPRDGDPLLFPSGKVDALRADFGVDSVRKFGQNIVAPGFVKRLFHFLFGRILPDQTDVFANRSF